MLAAAAAFFGLVRFGPRRPEGSAWHDGANLTTIDGRALRPGDVPPGGVVTVWPPEAVGARQFVAWIDATDAALRKRDQRERPQGTRSG